MTKQEQEHYKKVKSYIERMNNEPFYFKRYGIITKYVKGDNYSIIEYDILHDTIDIFDYELEIGISVDELGKTIIFYNDEIEAQYQKQEEARKRKYEEYVKNHPVPSIAILNGCARSNDDSEVLEDGR